MPRKQIPFSQLNTQTLLTIHNELAAAHGLEPLKSWRGAFVDLVKRVALLNTKTPPQKEKTKPEPKRRRPLPVKRKQPVRDAILEALAFVSHYETPAGIPINKYSPRNKTGLISVGLSYAEVAERVRKSLPTARVSGSFMRWTAAMARKGEAGFAIKLPQKRPHGTKRKP